MALEGAIADFGIPRRYLEDVIRGVETDLAVSRFQTFDDLRDYCYLVASTVGLICIEIFGYDDPAAVEYAVDLGLAMQLTNIMRDVKETPTETESIFPSTTLPTSATLSAT